MGATSNREQVVANSQFGGGATAFAPGTWYLGLSITTPSDDGTGFTEPVGNAYARLAIPNDSTRWAPATTSDGVTRKANSGKFTFVNPTGAWGQIIHWGLFLTSTGGSPEWVGALTSPIAPRNTNTVVEFDVGQFVLTFD